MHNQTFLLTVHKLSETNSASSSVLRLRPKQAYNVHKYELIVHKYHWSSLSHIVMWKNTHARMHTLITDEEKHKKNNLQLTSSIFIKTGGGRWGGVCDQSDMELHMCADFVESI